MKESSSPRTEKPGLCVGVGGCGGLEIPCVTGLVGLEGIVKIGGDFDVLWCVI